MRKLLIVTSLGLMSVSGAFAQNIDKNSACWKGLTSEYNTLLADRKKDTANIGKAEVAAFDAKLNTLKADWTKAQQGGVTEQECQAQRTGIKTLQADLNKMQSAGYASVMACILEYKKVLEQTNRIAADGFDKKTISPKESADHRARKQVVHMKFVTAVDSKSLTLQECNGFLKSANDEKAIVTKMASAAPGSAPQAPTKR